METEVICYRVEWWNAYQGALQTQRCKVLGTAEAMFDEKSKNEEIVEVRIIEEKRIAHHTRTIRVARD